MAVLQDIQIRNKLFIAFAIILLFTGGIGFAAFQSMDSLHATIARLHEVKIPSVYLLIEADRDLQQLRVAERTMISADPGTPQFAGLLRDYEDNLGQAGDRFEKFAALVSSADELALVEAFKQDRAAWTPTSKRVVDLAARGDADSRAQALDLSLRDSGTLFETMRDRLDKLTDLSFAEAQQMRERSQAAYQRALIILSIIFAAAIIVSVVLAVLLGFLIATPIVELTRACDDISTGNVNRTITTQRRDEIGQLAAAFKRMQLSVVKLMERATKNRAKQ